MKLEHVHLFVFMTRGMSLRLWEEAGMFEREVALYRALRPGLRAVTLVTYGGAEDLAFSDRLSGIGIICNRRGWPEKWYVRALPLLCRLRRKGEMVFKSNQTIGADIAVDTARRVGARFVARCGYPHAEFAVRMYGEGSPEAKAALALERRVFKEADRGIVATEAMKQSIVAAHGVAPDDLAVVPNYVQTDVFCPNEESATAWNRICFIGRLEAQKNVGALLKAIEGMDVAVDIVGEGSLRRELEGQAAKLGVRAVFHGNLPHGELPAIIRRAAVFVLPSHFEGHPKTLLEAMACGVAVIGADSPGIREVVRHMETGLLCGAGATDLRSAVETLLRDDSLRETLGRNARIQIERKNALARVVERELAVYEGLTA